MAVGDEDSGESARAHFRREPERLLKCTGEKRQSDVQNPSVKLKHKCKDLGKAYSNDIEQS